MWQMPIWVVVIGVTMLSVAGCKKPEPRTIVCIGDSLTVCGGEGGRYTDYLAKWLPNDTIINKGINGDTLAGGRARFDRDVLDLHPDVVIIELGANDFWQRQRTIDHLKGDLEDMVRRARAAHIEVVIASCFGRRDYASEKNVEFNASRFDFAAGIARMESQIVRKYRCFYVPNMQIDIKPNGQPMYWADKNHPNSYGNELVGRRILEQLTKALKASRTGEGR